MDTVAVVPTAVIIAMVSFLPILHVGNYIGGALRFALTQADYDKEVSLLPIDDKPRIRIFNWGGMIWVSRGIVYDDSDEIALPKGQQSKAWLDKARLTELGCGWDEHRLWSHYYLVSFPC